MMTNGVFAGAYAYALVTLEVSAELGGMATSLYSYVAPVGFSWPVTVPHPHGSQAFYQARAEMTQP